MKTNVHLIVSAALSIILSACNSSAPANTAPNVDTSAAKPSTTDTKSEAAAPQQVPAKAASVRVSERIQAALDAPSFEATYTLMVENAMGDAADGKRSEIIWVSETRAGAVSEIVMKSSLGGQLEGEQRYLQDGDTALYIKGPALALGAPDDAWYRASESQAKDYRPGVTPSSTLKDMLKSAASIDANARQAGSEAYEGQTCDVYLTDKSNITDRDREDTKRILKSLDGVIVKVVLCKDQLPVLVQFSYIGTGNDAEAKPASIDASVRLTKYDGVAAIVAPKDVKPLLTPGEAAIKPLKPTPTAKTTTADSGATTSIGLKNSNDGSFGTDYPLVGTVMDLVKPDSSLDMVNYTSDTPMKDVYAFYRDELTKQGLKERVGLTVFSDTTFSSVFDGLQDGRAIVVQVVDNSNGTVNVNVTKRKL